MELQHRLAKKSIEIAAGKALSDMGENLRRGVRNLVDLGLFFARSENQKRFFGAAKEMLSSPRSPYYAFASRVISEVDAEIVKTVGVNLGYCSLTYGAEKLQKSRSSCGFALPWLVGFEIPDSRVETLRKVERLISDGVSLGVYSYVCRPRNVKGVETVVKAAARFTDCLFILDIPPGLATDGSSSALAGVRNVAICLRLAPEEFAAPAAGEAFSTLKKRRLLFGAGVKYGDGGISMAALNDLTDRAIGSGCLFCVYIPEGCSPNSSTDAVHAFARAVRGESGKPIIALEWSRDMAEIGRWISSSGYLQVPIDVETDGGLRSGGHQASGLWDIIRLGFAGGAPQAEHP